MTEKKYQRYYDLAGKASFENWESIKKSKMCGCYYCRSIFPSSEVGEEDWTPDRHGRTVLCPKCSIDAVFGDESGIPIREDVLEELYQEKFGDSDFRILTTERLLIRPVLEQDAADIFEIRGDEDTADWAGVPCMKSIEDVSSQIDLERALSVVLGGEVIGLIEFFSDYELDGDFLGYYMKKSLRLCGTGWPKKGKKSRCYGFSRATSPLRELPSRAAGGTCAPRWWILTGSIRS